MLEAAGSRRQAAGWRQQATGSRRQAAGATRRPVACATRRPRWQEHYGNFFTIGVFEHESVDFRKSIIIIIQIRMRIRRI